jgi:hypothetical protein
VDGIGIHSVGIRGGKIERALYNKFESTVALGRQQPIDGGFIQADNSLVGGFIKHVGELEHNLHGRLSSTSACCIQDLDPATNGHRRVARIIGGTDEDSFSIETL